MRRRSGGSWTAVWSAKRQRIMCSWKEVRQWVEKLLNKVFLKKHQTLCGNLLKCDDSIEKAIFPLQPRRQGASEVAPCCVTSTPCVAMASSYGNFCTDSLPAHWQLPYIIVGWALTKHCALSVLRDKRLKGVNLPLVTGRETFPLQTVMGICH